MVRPIDDDDDEEIDPELAALFASWSENVPEAPEWTVAMEAQQEARFDADKELQRELGRELYRSGFTSEEIKPALEFLKKKGATRLDDVDIRDIPVQQKPQFMEWIPARGQVPRSHPVSEKRYRDMLFSRPTLRVKGKKRLLKGDPGMNLGVRRAESFGRPMTEEEEQGYLEAIDRPFWQPPGLDSYQRIQVTEAQKINYFTNLAIGARNRRLKRRYAQEDYWAARGGVGGRYGETAASGDMLDLTGRDTGNMQELIDAHYARQAAGPAGSGRRKSVRNPKISDMMTGGRNTSASWRFMSFGFMSKLQRRVKELIG